MIWRNGRLRPRSRSGGSRAVVLAVTGLVTLSLAFFLGVLVGRQWVLRDQPNGQTEPSKKPPAVARRGLSDAGTERAPQIQEKLTFYQTLPAPLASTPPPPRPEAKPREEAAKERPKVQPDPGAPHYTVQVLALGSKSSADDMERKLKDASYEAYVLAATGDDGRTTYRVRVGSFATRAEAEQVAERLRSERGVSPFVTTR